MKQLFRVAVVCVATVLPSVPIMADFVVIDFEDFAPVGGATNISPSSPYVEKGFTITPTNSFSAVVDSADPMIGNNSDWLGFRDTNPLTMTTAAGSFKLIDVLIGPNAFSSPPISMTITGLLSEGGTVNMTFMNISTATLAAVNFSNLQSVTFTATDFAALDNIRVEVVPEPSLLGVLIFFTTTAYSRRRANRDTLPLLNSLVTSAHLRRA